MTLDQIREAAIEAGAMAAAITEVNDYGTVAFSGEYHARTWDEVPPSTQAAILDKHRVLFRAAIDAYEAAMNRHFDDAPRAWAVKLDSGEIGNVYKSERDKIEMEYRGYRVVPVAVVELNPEEAKTP